MWDSSQSLVWEEADDNASGQDGRILLTDATLIMNYRPIVEKRAVCVLSKIRAKIQQNDSLWMGMVPIRRVALGLVEQRCGKDAIQILYRRNVLGHVRCARMNRVRHHLNEVRHQDRPKIQQQIQLQSLQNGQHDFPRQVHQLSPQVNLIMFQVRFQQISQRGHHLRNRRRSRR